MQFRVKGEINLAYQQRNYPLFSACGLNCGLCPRYQMTGASKCPGCCGENFLSKHPKCGVLSCSQRKEIEYCYQCADFPCKKYDGADQADSFITHLNQFKDMNKARALGIDTYKAELDEKISLLENLLADYDDGRRKGFLCLAVNLLALADVKKVAEQLELEVRPEQPVQARAATAACLFQAMAEQRGIVLKLRKKSKT